MGAAFVQVVAGTPRIKNVVASNQCHIGGATDGESVVIMAAIDNLVQGAAGGAVQWMNRGERDASVAVLLGASYLLPTAERTKALGPSPLNPC